MKSLYIFTRDLRIYDNTCLYKCFDESATIATCFIFTPEQISTANKYRSDRAVQFMYDSLRDLEGQLQSIGGKLIYYYDTYASIVSQWHDKIDAVYITQDYTPFAIKRENDLRKLCDKYKIKFVLQEDHFLTGSVYNVLKNDDTPYVKFTPYHARATQLRVRPPTLKKKYNGKFITSVNAGDIKLSQIGIGRTSNYIAGGRAAAQLILSKIQQFGKYNDTRDYFNIPTTNLSAYIKFGCVSIREVYTAFKSKLANDNKLVTQLYWRDFYMQVLYQYYTAHGINLLTTSMKNTGYKWRTKNATALFDKWRDGTTGIPLIDAGMRELKATGHLHNRLRMIVANFLVKVLGINWKLGEKHFAEHLIDYDPAVNNGNWQWCAGTGVDSQPYYRVFNPYSQAFKYDPNCFYIKKWVDELKSVEIVDIHDLPNKYKKYGLAKPLDITPYKLL